MPSSMAVSPFVDTSENHSTRFSHYLYSCLNCWQYPPPLAFIFYVSPSSTSSHVGASSASFLIIATIIAFISMEDLSILPTTITTTDTNSNTTFYQHDQTRTVLNPIRSSMSYNTTFYQHDQTTTVLNPIRSNMGYDWNHGLFSTGNAQSSTKASPIGHSQFYHTSDHQQFDDHTPQFPYTHLHEDVPMVLPTYLCQVEGSRTETGALSLCVGGFPIEVFSNGHVAGKVPTTCSLQPLGLSEFQEQRKLHCKVARSIRKMARQRSASLQNTVPVDECSSSLPSSSIRVSRMLAKSATTRSGNSEQRDRYTFCAPDNKKLRVLLKKELKSSDVGNGRIVLPKREAEENLPRLSSKEGILIVLRDLYSTQDWDMKYRFWANNRGRMYLLDHVGDFVKQNGLEVGDSMTLYDDKGKNLYFSIKKSEKPAPTPLNEQANAHLNRCLTFLTKEATEEEDSALQILLEELKHKEQLEAMSLTTLYTDGAAFIP